MPAGFIKNPADYRQTVIAAVESQRRLVPAFRRQSSHAFVIDIGRVSDDEIVALMPDRREQVAAQKADALLQVMVGDVTLGDLQGSGGQLYSIHLRLGKAQRRKDCQTSGAG